MDQVKGINSKHYKVHQLKKEKRYRSAFTTDQINCLEREFKKNPYIGVANRKELANIVHIPERAIKIWFQNRRMKEKKYASEKEINIDDQNKPNDLFIKDLLTNVHTSKSVNDQHHLQALLTTRNDRSTEVNSELYGSFNEFKEKMSPYFKKDINQELKPFDVFNPRSNRNFYHKICHDFHSKMNNVDNKRYHANTKINNDSDKNNLLFRDCAIKNISPTQSSIKKKHEAVSKKMLQNRSLHKQNYVKHQHRMSNIDPVYVPVSLQSGQSVTYSCTPGNALRKPVNIPLETGALRSVSRVKPKLSMSFINQAAKKCNCNCHADEIHKNGRTPYILAIPLSHFNNDNETNN